MNFQSFMKSTTTIVLCYCLFFWQLQPSVAYALRGIRPDNAASRNRQAAQRARNRGSDTSERTPRGQSDSDASRNREAAESARDRGSDNNEDAPRFETVGVPGLSDKNEGALNNIGKLNLFNDKGSKLLATDEQRMESQILKAEALKLFYEACKAQLMTKQAENIAALRSLTTNLADATSAVSDAASGLKDDGDGLKSAADETYAKARDNMMGRSTKIAQLHQACEESNCSCRACAGRSSGEGQEGASCGQICNDLKKARDPSARIDDMAQRADDLNAGTHDAQSTAEDSVSGTTEIQNSANETREKTFQAVAGLLSEINERSNVAIALARQARQKAMESIGALNSDYMLTNSMMGDMRISGVKNAEQTGVMASAAFDLCCQDISDVRCVSYHLYTAAASIYVASQMIDATDYSDAADRIMETDIDPNQTMNNQVENLQRAKMLREEMVKSSETLQQGKDSMAQMMTYVRMVAEQEIETAEARQENAEEAEDNTMQIMQMAMMALQMANMISNLNIGEEKATAKVCDKTQEMKNFSCKACGIPAEGGGSVSACSKKEQRAETKKEAVEEKIEKTQAKQEAHVEKYKEHLKQQEQKIADQAQKARDNLPDPPPMKKPSPSGDGMTPDTSFSRAEAQSYMDGSTGDAVKRKWVGDPPELWEFDKGAGEAYPIRPTKNVTVGADGSRYGQYYETNRGKPITRNPRRKDPNTKKQWNPDLSFILPTLPEESSLLLTPIDNDKQKTTFINQLKDNAIDAVTGTLVDKAYAGTCPAAAAAKCNANISAHRAAKAKSFLKDVTSVMSIVMMGFMLMEMFKAMKGKDQASKEKVAANIHGHMRCGATSPGAGLNCPLSVLKGTDNLMKTLPASGPGPGYKKEDPPPESDSEGNDVTLRPEFLNKAQYRAQIDSLQKAELLYEQQLAEFEDKWGEDIFMMSVMTLSSHNNREEGLNAYIKVLDLSRILNGARSSLPYTYDLMGNLSKKAKFISGRITDFMVTSAYAAGDAPADGNDVKKMDTVEKLEASLGVMKGSKAFQYYRQHRITAMTQSRLSFEVPEVRAEFLGMVEAQGQDSMTDMMDALDDADSYDDGFGEVIAQFDTNDGTTFDFGNTDITDGGLDALGDTSGSGLGAGGLGGSGLDGAGGGPGMAGINGLGGVGSDTLGGGAGGGSGAGGSGAGGAGAGGAGAGGAGAGGAGAGGAGSDGLGGIGGLGGGAGTGGASGSGSSSVALGGAGAGGAGSGAGGIGAGGAGAGGPGGSALGRSNVNLGAGGSTAMGGGRGGRFGKKGMGSSSAASARKSSLSLSRFGTVNPHSPVGQQIEAMKHLIRKTMSDIKAKTGTDGGISSGREARNRGRKMVAAMRLATINDLKKGGDFDKFLNMSTASKSNKYRPKGNVKSFGSLSSSSILKDAANIKGDPKALQSMETAQGVDGSEFGGGEFDDEDDYGDLSDGFGAGGFGSGSVVGDGDDSGLDGMGNAEFQSAEDRYKNSLRNRNVKRGAVGSEINPDSETSLFRLLTKRYKKTAYPIFYKKK